VIHISLSWDFGRLLDDRADADADVRDHACADACDHGHGHANDRLHGRGAYAYFGDE